MRRLAILVGVLAMAAGPAVASPPSWIATHALLEGSVGGGWRVAVGGDPHNPGFLASTVGGELLVGLELGAGAGFVVGGHGRWGSAAGVPYWEGVATLGAQLQVGARVRMRLGADLGRAFLESPSRDALMAGGWIESGIDVLSVGGHGVLLLTVRLDLTSFAGDVQALPQLSTSFGAGIGGRY